MGPETAYGIAIAMLSQQLNYAEKRNIAGFLNRKLRNIGSKFTFSFMPKTTARQRYRQS